MPIPHRRIRGHLHYTSDRPDRKGVERGREDFTLTFHGDGRRTLRAYTEIDDAPNVMRDVTLNLDRSGKPSQAYVQISVGDELVGSTWYHFAPTEASCEGFTREEGRISQRFALTRPVDAFGTHPIVADGWLMGIVDLDAGSAVRVYYNVFMSSLDHRGATGPTLVPHRHGVPIRFMGRERITVVAGTFDALHFRITETDDDATDTRNEPGKHPPYDLWVTADGDYVMLRACVTGYMMTRYELTEYEVSAARP